MRLQLVNSVLLPDAIGQSESFAPNVPVDALHPLRPLGVRQRGRTADDIGSVGAMPLDFGGGLVKR